MNRIAMILVVLLTGGAASGCRKEVVEPDQQKSVGAEIEQGLHDADDATDEADDDVDEGTDEAKDQLD